MELIGAVPNCQLSGVGRKIRRRTTQNSVVRKHGMGSGDVPISAGSSSRRQEVCLLLSCYCRSVQGLFQR